MKKILFLSVLAFVSIVSKSQSLQKGNLVGVHTDTVKLNGNTKMQQFVDYFSTKYAPAFASAFSCEMRVLKYVRGESKNKLSYIFIMKNEEARNKYFTKDGKLNTLGKTTLAKLKPISDELDKLGKSSGTYTDWVVL